MASKKQQKWHYYSQDESVPLQREPDWFAIDLDELADGSVPRGIQTRARKAGSMLRRNLLLLERASISVEDLKQLGESGKAQPVFRHEDALIVVLPEVRVSLKSGDQEDRVLDEIRHSKVPVTLEHKGRNRLVIRPESGRGEEALEMANRIFETCDVEMAQARFIRVVPRPDSPTRRPEGGSS